MIKVIVNDRFSNGIYSNALEYTKYILKESSSIDDIIKKANILEETEEDLTEGIKDNR